MKGTRTYQRVSDQAVRIIAEIHIRTMLNYHMMRSLVDTNALIEAERSAVTTSAIESRRYGFRLEAQVESLGLQFDTYDEDRLRREAARIAQMLLVSELEARQAAERLVEEFVSQIFERQEKPLAQAA